MRLENKVALVTGGSQGLGQAMCELFAKEGARVIALDMAPMSYEFDNVAYKQLNVTDALTCKQVFDEIVEEYGRIDVLVNNAGITRDAMTRKMTDEQWDLVMDVNEKVFAFVGHFFTGSIVATMDYLKEKGIPMVYFASGVNTLFNEKAEGNDRVAFPVQPILVTEGQVMVARAVANFGAKKIGMIYTNDDAGKDMYNGAVLQAKTLNVELVAEQVEALATDVSAAVTNIVSAGVDVVLAGTIQPTLPTIINGLVAQGNTKTVITSYNNAAADIAKLIEPSVSGKFDVYAAGWIDMTQESAAAELADYLANINPDHAASAFATAGWIAGHFFTEGLKAVGTNVLSWNNYVDALENASIKIPFGGLVDFKDGRRVGTDSMTLMKLGLVKGADDVEAPGWSLEKPLQNIEQILAGN